MIGLDHVHGGAHDRLLQGLEPGLLMENDVGGVLDLHEAPVHAVAEVAEHRAAASCPRIEMGMQSRRIEAVGETLGFGGIADAQKGVGCGSSETTEPEKINRGLAGSSRGNIDDGASFTVGN
jgi:hypothetical protein